MRDRGRPLAIARGSHVVPPCPPDRGLFVPKLALSALTVLTALFLLVNVDLIEGLDDIALTLRKRDEIELFESERPTWKPQTLPTS